MIFNWKNLLLISLYIVFTFCKYECQSPSDVQSHVLSLEFCFTLTLWISNILYMLEVIPLPLASLQSNISSEPHKGHLSGLPSHLENELPHWTNLQNWLQGKLYLSTNSSKLRYVLVLISNKWNTQEIPTFCHCGHLTDFPPWFFYYSIKELVMT